MTIQNQQADTEAKTFAVLSMKAQIATAFSALRDCGLNDVKVDIRDASSQTMARVSVSAKGHEGICEFANDEQAALSKVKIRLSEKLDSRVKSMSQALASLQLETRPSDDQPGHTAAADSKPIVGRYRLATCYPSTEPHQHAIRAYGVLHGISPHNVALDTNYLESEPVPYRAYLATCIGPEFPTIYAFAPSPDQVILKVRDLVAEALSTRVLELMTELPDEFKSRIQDERNNWDEKLADKICQTLASVYGVEERDIDLGFSRDENRWVATASVMPHKCEDIVFEGRGIVTHAATTDLWSNIQRALAEEVPELDRKLQAIRKITL